ncbi:MAG: tRNA (adenosine(37)-N6)-threonylcarbamoyltransferase complex ATPase subunit type 1 TsaE [Thermoflexales bacterium]|nr:tRNA (adenosine(37)-N6)-threonylcarbamoyltransferase complex ATPase subunit type 1 TsaE [Thermoflexales bacterium]
MPILDPLSFECVSHSDEQTQRLGARFAQAIPPVCVVALQGDLGAGKTHFARGIGMGWGAAQELRSPTFTMLQEHHREPDAGARLYHVDLYRAERAEDVASTGLLELLEDNDGVIVIEWPERAWDQLPPEALRVRFAVTAPSKRNLTFSTQSASAWQTLLKFRKLAFGV